MILATVSCAKIGNGLCTTLGTGVMFTLVVERIPIRGFFMWPFAVAGLGGRYFVMRCSDRLGQPSRNPERTAFSSVEIGGLHIDWCANLTAFSFVRMECAKAIVSFSVDGGGGRW